MNADAHRYDGKNLTGLTGFNRIYRINPSADDDFHSAN
jgi:hypothetical protein